MEDTCIDNELHSCIFSVWRLSAYFSVGRCLWWWVQKRSLGSFLTLKKGKIDKIDRQTEREMQRKKTFYVIAFEWISISDFISPSYSSSGRGGGVKKSCTSLLKWEICLVWCIMWVYCKYSFLNWEHSFQYCIVHFSGTWYMKRCKNLKNLRELASPSLPHIDRVFIIILLLTSSYFS